MIFHKYHAVGNDFIIMNYTDGIRLDPRAVCSRHTGIGADGILLYKENDRYDAEMIVVNSDGSIAEMCGNGLRCFAHWMTHTGKAGTEQTILTGKGPLTCSVADHVVSASLGPAVGSVRHAVTQCDSVQCDLYAVNMGNPHLVVVPQNPISKKEAEHIAHAIDYTALYTESVNIEVIYRHIEKHNEVHAVVLERGVGFTLGCGTGAAAIYTALFAANKSGTVVFPGGTLVLTGDPLENIILKGEVHNLFYGELNGECCKR